MTQVTLPNIDNPDLQNLLQRIELLDIEPDGHCFLYAVIKYWHYPLPNLQKPDLHQLKCHIFWEAMVNTEYYVPFCVLSTKQCLAKGIRNYLLHKAYSNQFGDNIIGIAANALQINISVLDVMVDGQIRETDHSVSNGCHGSLILHRTF